jgi:hypothetical protein
MRHLTTTGRGLALALAMGLGEPLAAWAGDAPRDCAAGGQRVALEVDVVTLRPRAGGGCGEASLEALSAHPGALFVSDGVAEGRIVLVSRPDLGLTLRKARAILRKAGCDVEVVEDRDAEQAAVAALQSQVLSIPADAVPPMPGTMPTGDRPVLTSLRDTLDPLREHLNFGRGKLRFVAILSPT